jgi:hypothetical protein
LFYFQAVSALTIAYLFLSIVSIKINAALGACIFYFVEWDLLRISDLGGHQLKSMPHFVRAFFILLIRSSELGSSPK